jgi:hypothetical protein
MMANNPMMMAMGNNAPAVVGQQPSMMMMPVPVFMQPSMMMMPQMGQQQQQQQQQQQPVMGQVGADIVDILVAIPSSHNLRAP